jgi:hypothetical protein
MKINTHNFSETREAEYQYHKTKEAAGSNSNPGRYSDLKSVLNAARTSLPE